MSTKMESHSVTLIVRSNPFFERFQEWNPILNRSAPIFYEMEIALAISQDTALSEIHGIIYSDYLHIPEPHIIEEVNRIIEAGATGTEYTIVIEILTEMAANIGTEILKGLVQKIQRKAILQQDEAFKIARSHLTSKTRLPIGYFDVVSSTDTEEAYIFSFHEKSTNKNHHICVRKHQSVIEYSVNIG